MTDHSQWLDRIQSAHGQHQVMAELDRSVFWDLDAVGHALDASFKARCAPLADHILGQWKGLLNLNHAPDNGASWPTREALLYLRGKSDISWLERLLRGGALGGPTTERRGLLTVMIQEMENIGSYGIGEEISALANRLPVFVDCVLAHSAACAGFHDRASPSKVLAALMQKGPWSKEPYQSLLCGLVGKIELGQVQVKEYEKIQDDLRQAMGGGEVSVIKDLATRFWAIPESHRTLSPFRHIFTLIQASTDTQEAILHEKFKALLESDIDASAVEPSGSPPILTLIEYWGEEIENNRAMKLLQEFLNKGIDLNQCEGLRRSTVEVNTDHASGASILHMASTNRHVPFELLIRACAQLDLRDAQGTTALLYACREVHFDLIHSLVRHHAAPLPTPDGNTPLHELLSNAFSPIMDPIDLGVLEETILLLHRAGVELESVNDEGLTPAQVLCQAIHDPICASHTQQVLEYIHALGHDVFLPSDHPHSLVPMLKSRPVAASVLAWIEHHQLNEQTKPAAAGVSRPRM